MVAIHIAPTFSTTHFEFVSFESMMMEDMNPLTCAPYGMAQYPFHDFVIKKMIFSP